jgi:hypothetical protein
MRRRLSRMRPSHDCLVAWRLRAQPSLTARASRLPPANVLTRRALQRRANAFPTFQRLRGVGNQPDRRQALKRQLIRWTPRGAHRSCFRPEPAFDELIRRGSPSFRTPQHTSVAALCDALAYLTPETRSFGYAPPEVGGPSCTCCHQGCGLPVASLMPEMNVQIQSTACEASC